MRKCEYWMIDADFACNLRGLILRALPLGAFLCVLPVSFPQILPVLIAPFFSPYALCARRNNEVDNQIGDSGVYY